MKFFLVTYTVMRRKKAKQNACVIEAETARKAKEAIQARGSSFLPLRAERVS